MLDAGVMAAILDSIKDPVMFVDMGHVIRYMNKAAVSHFDDGEETIRRIAALADPRAVVTLMDYIADDRSSEDMLVLDDEDEVTCTRGDLAIAAIVLQTGQSLADYGFYGAKRRGVMQIIMGRRELLGTIGFDKKAKRQAARKKIRVWWDKNKKKYDGVEKIDLSGEDSGEPRRRGLPAFIRMLGG